MAGQKHGTRPPITGACLIQNQHQDPRDDVYKESGLLIRKLRKERGLHSKKESKRVEVCTPRGLRNTLGPYLASTDLRPATGAVARQPVFPPGHVPCASEILKHAKRNECQPAKRSAIWLLISQNLSNSLQVLPKMLIDSSCSAPNCSAFFQDLPSSLL